MPRDFRPDFSDKMLRVVGTMEADLTVVKNNFIEDHNLDVVSIHKIELSIYTPDTDDSRLSICIYSRQVNNLDTSLF